MRVYATTAGCQQILACGAEWFGRKCRVEAQIVSSNQVVGGKRLLYHLAWALRISSGVSKGIYKSVVQGDRKFLRIGAVCSALYNQAA